MKKSVGVRLLNILSVLIITALAVFGYCENDVTNYSIIRKENALASIETVFEEKNVEKKEEAAPIENNNYESVQEVRYESNNESNDYSYNRIVIPNALDDHLMKDTTGEHFYLNHDLNGNYDGRGVPYIDFRTDFTGRKTIIYSHSSQSGNGPFQALQNYNYNKNYYDNHRYITIYYEGHTYTYEIFSVYVSVADSEESEGLEYFHNMSYTDSEWEETLNRYKNNSDYDTGVNVNSSDKILILQTCSMNPNFYQKYYRYNLLIMAKLI